MPRRYLKSFHRLLRRFLRVTGAIAFFLFATVLPTAGLSDALLLRSGDVLTLTILGEPDRTFSVPVEFDGTAWFPVIGGFPAGKRSLDDIRAEIINAYSATSLNFDDTGQVQLLRETQIHLVVEAYRPFYVTGALARAVVVPYQPGLNLQQILAIAASEQPLLRDRENSTTRTETLIRELERIETRVWGLRARLGHEDLEVSDVAFAERSAEQRQLAALESQNVKAIFADRARDLESVEALVDFTEVRLEALAEQRLNELEAKTADDIDLQYLNDLRQRGLASVSRLSEARRAALTSATRVLQLETAIADAQIRLSDLRAQKKELSSPVDVEAWTELADQLGLLYRTQAALAAQLQDEPHSSPREFRPQQVVITRDEGVTMLSRIDDRSITLLPGDVIEVVPTDHRPSHCNNC